MSALLRLLTVQLTLIAPTLTAHTDAIATLVSLKTVISVLMSTSVSKELTTVMPTPHVPIGSDHLIALVTLVTPVLVTFVLISMSVLLCSVPPWVVLIHAQRTVSVPTLTDHTLALARLVSLGMDSHAKILMNVPTSTLVPMLPTLPASTQLVASTVPVTPDGSRAQTDNVPIL